MGLDFTVVVPTYNGATRLPLVLERLRSQVTPEPLTWEILVVDNNSTDNTAAIVQAYQTHWDYPFPLRYCFAAKQGLASARQRGIEEAQGEFVAFLDDDNFPAPNWIANAHAFGQDHPQAGAFSGQIHGEFEVPPPEQFKRIQAFLAIRHPGGASRQFEPGQLRLPPGAGLVVRQQAWYQNVPKQLRLRGRRQRSLVAGEDYEALLHLHKAGWEIWYCPTMHLSHQIPRQRLERGYLLTLARSTGLATCQLRLVTAAPWQIPIICIRTILGNLRRIALHLIRYRGQFSTNLIAAFELQFFLGSVLSPFYVVKNRLS
ncbi:glycosyltransferase family 2 protein [Oculatella sp. LEGE 06141]|uniref:hormogonium polysaccharide biosynthesis glycosyltransferase HpsE n=1 Tax=Oculatella sp. LEGE 06141 TaxID=1828648 RepID=UPI0018830374|nr:hormogonium polysaccharide biosynthesis glycosyltransferase HpsE [Oculatella sp. LEGE 06141]MBE9179227.1 glycosyltransferase family 2 protein [Oculatella sp. LEGE 06141]